MRNVLNKSAYFDREQLINNEWLLTNGIGGYACGSLSNIPMRRYHSLLTAALPNPYGRTVMLNYVADTIVLPNKKRVSLSQVSAYANELIELPIPIEFRLENGLPLWIYDLDGVIIEKSLLLIHQQNTLHMSYKLKSDHQDVEIQWRPFLHFRHYENPVDTKIMEECYTVHAKDQQYEFECPGFPVLKLINHAETPFTVSSEVISTVYYENEDLRGYASIGSLKSPGFYTTPLVKGERVTFIASTDSWETILTLSPKEAWLTEKMRKKGLLKAAGAVVESPGAATLVLAADQFIIKPATRFQDMIRLQASGEEIKSILAGFPWFTDWGRDTMISLEGLTLCTGRHREAYAILHTFAHYIHEGLIPNMFPDGENKGIYNTADATLWFFHAIDRYISVTGDAEILEFLLPKLENIIQHHVKGTLFGIKMDEDGLLIQGYPQVQLTWMDAKVGDYVVTPRRGKAVEINALWYNALRLYETWSNQKLEFSEKCYESFNKKFWYEPGNYLFDVIEGEAGFDSALRPNQLFAISLRHPVLEERYWKPVLDCVTRELYTPVGLRTLAPGHPDYKSKYDGDLYTRDAAYHQGSVWPWLLGAYIDVWLKVYPEDHATPLQIIKELEAHSDSHCLGTIGEIFDASPPYRARGCFAQAWSVAELLRSMVKVKNQKG
ncbi:MAG: glycogen debranching enzyme family protein [Parachlamydiaceae bacterium]|nr:glycogen debranching enzyme family protein [Parachlamydiaceae bacterium]